MRDDEDGVGDSAVGKKKRKEVNPTGPDRSFYRAEIIRVSESFLDYLLDK
jgi:hypothetical protein